jgi:hypothetical protein
MIQLHEENSSDCNPIYTQPQSTGMAKPDLNPFEVRLGGI